MFTMRRRLQRLSWIAFFAIFGLAFAPTISHAMAAAAGNSLYTEVCTPQGTRLVSLADGSEASGPEASLSGAAGLHFDHCPLCGLGGQAPLPPSAPPTDALATPALSHAVPRLFLQAHRPLFAWAAAQPRAPPLNS
ncbi:MAG: hypothetical protein CFE46_17560 [Burkholderiales bacterium PBB6]|nr:MAG: hypothetical protein CFE46_17560 [Burkholderiales bacterium PBB6]